MQIPEETIEKLRKLLRLSASPNEHEAALALSRAQEIAIRHQIDLASVRIEERPVESIDRELLDLRNTRHRRFILWILEKHFSVALMHTGGTSGKQVWFIGSKNDIVFAQWIYSYLDKEFPRLWTAYMRRNYVLPKESTAYFFGLFKGLDAKLTESKEAAVSTKLNDISLGIGEEFRQKVSNSFALAVRNKTVELARKTDEFFPCQRKSRPARVNTGDGSTLAAGREAGRSINLNRPLAQGSRNLVA